MPTFRAEGTVSDEPDRVLEWYRRPGALIRLLPPWESISVEREAPGLAEGDEVTLRLGGRLRWVLRHAHSGPTGFTDTQVRGPFAAWTHRHTFEPTPEGGTRVRDEISYRLPVTQLAAPWLNSRLRRAFEYRHRQLTADLAAHAGVAPMTVAVTGTTGLIGTALCAFLESGGHRVIRLVRRVPRVPDELAWDPEGGTLDADALRDVDAVVHLAGVSIAGRFTPAHKEAARRSRVLGTGLLARTLASIAPAGPRTLITASGIGYYGASRDERVDETAGPGDDFLAQLCREWEAATSPAREAGLRVVHMRTGIVQSPAGGALHVQLPLFLAGAGGRLGSGRQWQSWISIDDVVGAYYHALTHDTVSGPVNAVAPHPVRNSEYTETLARILHRPSVLPTPFVGPRLLLGEEGARLAALASQNVHCGVLSATGFHFRHPDLETCLRHVLGR